MDLSFLLSYAASLPLNPQMLHAEGSLHDSQTFSLSISFGSFMKIAFMVLVMGFPSDQAILLKVTDADTVNSGV
jgi:hypothetical protein